MPGATSNPTSSLNDRLKNLNSGGDVDYRPKRVAIGDAQSVFNDAMAAYEARFAPPPEILSRTFGFVYGRRKATEPDSLAYVYDSFSVGPITMCKAWKIVEHPYVPVHEVGAVAGSAGIGGGVTTNANSPVVRHDNGADPEVRTVVFPCTEKSYTAVPRGSMKKPLPLHPDLGSLPSPAALGTPAAPSTPAPAASGTPPAPAPSASLAP